MKSRNEIDKQLESRAEYDSSMLWMIAQPTRKEPEKLLSFGQIFGRGDYIWLYVYDVKYIIHIEPRVSVANKSERR